MSQKTLEQEISELRDRIRLLDKHYYVLNDPRVSDFEYDQLMKRLIKLEAERPDLVTPCSPTQRVSGEPLSEFPTVIHRVPMMSMDNTYNSQDLREFDERIRRRLGAEGIEYVVELKLDGLAVNLTYEDGIFVLGSTRGDGSRGDDVTANLRTIRNIPLSLGLPPETRQGSILEVHGEVVMPKPGFERLNQERSEEGLPFFANPRNAAAGSLKLLDARITAQRPLLFVAHGAGAMSGFDFHRHTDFISFLQDAGMPVEPHREICQGIDEVVTLIERYDTVRHDLEIQMDGLVVKVNDRQLQERLGATSKSPRWQIAYKFPPDQAFTGLNQIQIQVGRTGILTPVAVLEPVFLAGSTISRATLHNADELARLDIRVGDIVRIEKAGEVIPRVVKVLVEKRSGKETPFTMPEQCPACSSPVIREEGAVAFRCINASCPAQIEGRLRHFASRNAMDIEGLGHFAVHQLVSKGLIRDFSDLYALDMTALCELDRFAEKSGRNLYEGIQSSKSRSLERFIFGLGILNVGAHAAQILARHFKSMEAFQNASLEDLQSLSEIGPISAASVRSFFENPDNLRILTRMRDLGVSPKSPESAPTSQSLNGKIFVLTGTLRSWSRDQAKRAIEAAGGRVTSSVSQKTDYVVVGEEPGSKLNQAQALGVPTISEEGLKTLMGTDSG